MINNYDDREDVNDYDEDIREREKLIEEAKQLQAIEDVNSAMKDVLDLKRRYKRISFWDSAYEETLNEQFEQCLDAFYAKRNEGYGSNKAVKQDLIARAKEVTASNNLNQATTELNELMSQWKVCGPCGKEEDDRLWEEFNALRQAFFDRKKAYWENLQGNFENARTVKKELIEKAAALKDSIEWQKTSEAYRELFEQWKALGSAGKDHEDELWNAFNAHRQVFYDNRGAYYDEQRTKQEAFYEEKNILVEKAKAIVSTNIFSREHTEAMKQLGLDWKNIGSCGKEKEDQIWREFRSTMDAYFDGLKRFNDEKHAKWLQHMHEIRTRKLDMIQNQKRQIKYMQEEIVGLLGQRAIDEMQEDIEDAEVFIKQLEDEIADIDKKIAS